MCAFSFVSDIVGTYYPSDASVGDDKELQAWVREIFSEGFLCRESSGTRSPAVGPAPAPGLSMRLSIPRGPCSSPALPPGVPSSVDTRGALAQYLTMVIFTCSARHTAVSAAQVRKGQASGPAMGEPGSWSHFISSAFQFDSCVWMPNLPPSMQLPPPTAKGQARPESFIAALPAVNATCDVIIALWLLSQEPGDRVSSELVYMLFTLLGPNSTLASRPKHVHLPEMSQGDT